MSVPDTERSPKGDHNRRIALGMSVAEFASVAGVSEDELREYEATGPDHAYDLAIAHRVGNILDRAEEGEPDLNLIDEGPARGPRFN
jgi:transcriptional regulator with XRE-family HTH domain